MTEAGGKLRARLALPYRRTPALVRSRRNAICPAWSSAAPSPARCEPIPAFLLILACAIASARPWNIRQRVEHRGAHQAPFYAGGLSEIIAVSENAPGAHGAGLAGVDGAGGGGRTQEGANGDWCGSAARLSDGNRRGRKIVARDEQKRMADMAAWGNVLGVTMRATERSRRKDGR